MGLLCCNCLSLCKIYLISNVILGLIFAESTTLKADVPTGPKFIQETKTCTIKAVVDPITHQEIPVSQAIKRGKHRSKTLVIVTFNLMALAKKSLFYIPNTMIDSDAWNILFEILEAGNWFVVSGSCVVYI